MRPHVHSSLARATRVEGRGGPTASSDVNWDFSNKIKRYVISPCKIAARTARSLHLALCLNMHCSTTMPSPRGEIRVSTGDPYTPAHRAREITCRTFPRTSRATVLVNSNSLRVVARHDGEKLGWIVLDLGAAKSNAKRTDYMEGACFAMLTTEWYYSFAC
eukprot:9478817-Pyramimonas_sp.AAC.2